MRKKILYISSIFLMAMLIGCSSPKLPSSAQTVEEQDTVERLENLKPISEVANSAYSDLQDAKSTCKKLTFANLNPYCPDVDTVYDFTYTRPDNYKKIDNEKDMLEAQFPIIEFCMEEPMENLDIEKFESSYYLNGEYNLYVSADGVTHDSFSDFLADEERNATRVPSTYLQYGDEEAKKQAVLYRDLWDMTFERGGDYGPLGLKIVKNYYVYDEDDNLDDEWMLQDGTVMSVRDAIAFQEDYINHKLPIEGQSDEVEIKVHFVEVYRMSNNPEHHFFRFYIRRCVGGVMEQPLRGGSILNELIHYEMGYGFQLVKGNLDRYSGPTRIMQYEKRNETGEILSLGDAINILEDELGENSQYKITRVELGYLKLSESTQNWAPVNGTVCWVFRSVNEQDMYKQDFYVNAQTGKITTSAWRSERDTR